MSDSIKIELDNWLFNSGVVGLQNILDNSQDKVNLEEQSMEIDKTFLDGFEEKYFGYLIKTYEKTLSWHKITSYKNTLDYHLENDFSEFSERDLQRLNDYIQNTVKRYLKSNSYKASYTLIDSKVDILELEKKLSTVRYNKKDTIEKKLPEIREMILKLHEIIDFCETVQAKSHLASKNVIYTIIKNAWNGISFLNPQTKELDPYVNYRDYFVEPVREYLTEDKSKFKYNCFVCDRKIKNLKDHLSFLNATGFDVDKKSSHVWNFKNDIAVCPICKLVYSCVPAGITYVYDKGIYVNYNTNIKKAVNINAKMKVDILKNKLTTNSAYKALLESFQNQALDKVSYELLDVQIIKYENQTYRFNLLSKRILKIINESNTELEALTNTGYKEINTYFNIYNLVIESLFNNQNLFILIHKLLVYKLTQPNDSYFYKNHVLKVLNINTSFLKEVGYMNSLEKDEIKYANTAGYYLKEKYRTKGSVDKLNGVAYRLLNSLKTNNTDSFMDTLLNCYLYVGDSVPKVFLKALNRDEEFRTIGYAFVAGIIEEKNKENA